MMGVDVPSAGLKTPMHRADWQTQRLKYLFKRVSRPVKDGDEVVTAFRDGVVTRRSNRRQDGFTFAAKEIGYQGIEPGDLAIHAMDGFAGAIGVSDSAGKVSPVLSVLAAKNGADADPTFWAYYLRSVALSGYIQSLAKGIRERSTDFRWKDAGDLLVNHPDLPTQKRIAEFLDRETARIDQLIEKKMKLNEVLKEKLVQEITKVFGGLTDAKRVRLRHIAEIAKGRATAGEAQDQGEHPLLTMEYLRSGVATKFVMPKSQDVLAEDGNTLVVWDGSNAGEFIPARRGVISSTVARISFRKPHCPSYMMYALKEHELALRGTCQGMGIPHVDGKQLKNLKIAWVDLDSQKHLASQLSKLHANSNAAAELTQRSITFLIEYRSALITAAVTGQLDVSSHQALEAV